MSTSDRTTGPRPPLHRSIRGIHRVLAPMMLLILALWGVSGIYFAAYDLYLWWEYRAGDPDARRREGAAVLDTRGGRRPGRLPVGAALAWAEAAARSAGTAPAVRALTYRWVGERPLYEIAFEGPPYFTLLDADTGVSLSPVTPELAGAIALDAFGRSVPIVDVERRTDYSFHYFRNASYRSGNPRGGFMPYYLVWLGDTGRTLVVVSEVSGQVLQVRDLAKRLYWYGYWFLHTYLFHPSGVGQLVSDMLLLVLGATALFGAITGSYLFVNYHVLRRRSRQAVEKWRATAVATK